MVTQAEILAKYGHGGNVYGYVDAPNGAWFAEGESWGDWTGLNNFRESAVTYTLSRIRNIWGLKHIRLLVRFQWLIDGTAAASIARVCDLAQAQGMYVIVCPWVNIDDVTALPYSTQTPDNAAWASQWQQIAAAINKPNVVYELWNEPNDAGTGMQRANFFAGCQMCINAIRTVNTNAIIVSWDYRVWGDIQLTPDLEDKNASTLNWIWLYPLTDSANNLIYGFHNYENGFIDSQKSGEAVTDEAGIRQGYTMSLVKKAMDEGKPLWNTEVGAMWQNQTEMQPWFHNTLKVTKEWVKCPITTFALCFMGWSPYGEVASTPWMASPAESAWTAQEIALFLSDQPKPPTDIPWLAILLMGGLAVTIVGLSMLGNKGGGTNLGGGDLGGGGGVPSGASVTTATIKQPPVAVSMNIKPKPIKMTVVTE